MNENTDAETAQAEKTLRLEGSLTVLQIGELRTQVMEALKSTKKLTLDLEQAAAVDVTCLQVLYAARRYAEDNGKGFSVKTNDAVANEIRAIGFSLATASTSG